MPIRVPCLPTAAVLILCSSAFAQFLPGLPVYDPSVNLNFFTQADINHDGKTDIVGIQPTSPPRITVLLGDGQGGFGSPIDTTITGVNNVNPGPFMSSDFNGDGHRDVGFIGTDPITGATVVAVMLGNGVGTFQTPPKETSIASFQLSSVGPFRGGDFNGDGKIDVAFVYGNTVNVMFGKGDGTFSSPVSTSLSLGNQSLTSLAAGDFNHDKKMDLVAATSGNEILILLSNGDGTFQSPITAGKGQGPIVIADLNGDGNLDLVTENPSGNAGATVLLGDGTGHFPTQHSYFANAFSPIIAVSDLNGDGHPDLALLDNSHHVVSILLNKGNGSFTVGKTYSTGGRGGSGLVAADLNGDKKADLAFGGAGGIAVLAGNGDGTFKGNFALPATGQIRAGEFNSDRKPDLLLSPSNGLLLGNGNGTFTPRNVTCVVSLFALGDFNNSGNLGFAGVTSIGGVPAIETCLGNGNGTFTEVGPSDLGILHGVVLAGDFNNDGKLDLVASDQGGFSILLGNGDGTFQNGIPTATSASVSSLAVGDFNHDGKKDVVALTTSGIAVFLGKGDGTFNAPIITSVSLFSHFLMATDLNKDGNLDLVVTGPLLWVFLGKGDGTFQKPVQYSNQARTPAVIADFNGDGNPDVAVDAGIFLGDGHGKLLTPVPLNAGGGTITSIASSDFNGDGKPDLAVKVSDGVVVIMLHQ
jgi:hypothetical protein